LTWNILWDRYMEELHGRQPDRVQSVDVTTRVSRTDSREPKGC
jgi:hypothetical protein